MLKLKANCNRNNTNLENEYSITLVRLTHLTLKVYATVKTVYIVTFFKDSIQ